MRLFGLEPLSDETLGREGVSDETVESAFVCGLVRKDVRSRQGAWAGSGRRSAPALTSRRSAASTILCRGSDPCRPVSTAAAELSSSGSCVLPPVRRNDPSQRPSAGRFDA